MAQRRVMTRGEAEADAHPVDAGRDLLGAQVDDNAQLGQHVGGTGRRRRGPIAVLGDRGTHR